MARIRTIKPSFFTSESVAGLPLRARLTWVGLWTHCDDQGRCKDNARLIKAAVWPLDDFTLSDVEDDLDALARQGRILRYQVGDRCFIQITNWVEHQRINRPSGSELPGPPSGPDLPDGPHGALSVTSVTPQGGNGQRESSSEKPQATQLTTDSVSDPGGLTEDSSQERKGREGKKHLPPRSAPGLDRFDEFYDAYPRHIDRKDAEKAWSKATRSHPPDLIIAATKRYAATCRGKDPKFIKYPATWLNKGGYLDEPEPLGLRLVVGEDGVRRDPKTGRVVESWG